MTNRTHDFSAYKPVVAHVTNLERLGLESQLFPPEAMEGLNRDFEVWQMSVSVDGQLFEPIILADDGEGTICFYGFGEESDILAEQMPEQARLLAYLRLRTAQTLAVMGPFAAAFAGASESAERIVMRAYSDARGHTYQY